MQASTYFTNMIRANGSIKTVYFYIRKDKLIKANIRCDDTIIGEYLFLLVVRGVVCVSLHHLWCVRLQIISQVYGTQFNTGSERLTRRITRRDKSRQFAITLRGECHRKIQIFSAAGIEPRLRGLLRLPTSPWSPLYMQNVWQLNPEDNIHLYSEVQKKRRRTISEVGITTQAQTDAFT